MHRLPVLAFCLALLAGSCGGGTSAEVAPWGLEAIDMPASVEDVQATIAAFPDEIEGLTRSGGGVVGG